MLKNADIFGEVFALGEDDQEQLHRQAAAIVRAEALAWRDDEPQPPA